MSARQLHSKLSTTGLIKVIGVALLAATLTLTALVFYLSRGLPSGQTPNVEIPAAGLKFAFGSGHPEQDVMQVNKFADGFALLSSGPVKVQADELSVLQYIWEPDGQTDELAFFWRQQGNTAEVKRAEISIIGSALLDLSDEPDWKGKIVEVGYLVAGDAAHPVTIGQLVLKPDDLATRLKLVWQDWTTYELRSQQSINFLQGGARNQVAPLPVVLIIWWLTTLLLVRLVSGWLGVARAGSTFLIITVALLLSGWMLLDIRWTANSYRSAGELLSSATGADPEQHSENDLDGGIYKYIQRLKTDIIQSGRSEKVNRILIIGDENTTDYYLLRAKYHLLPDSAHVAGMFEESLSPGSLDYVIYFGQSGAIVNIPGWNTAWRNALKEVDRNEWGIVYRVRP